jgi:isoleucyl-tRNA synthetase
MEQMRKILLLIYSIRLYLINSPVVRAEPLKFKEEGVFEVVKKVFLPWSNAYRFFVQNSNIYYEKYGELFTSTEASKTVSENIMDVWISSVSQSLIEFVKKEMEGYRLYTVIPKLMVFLDNLTNWYVRTNRKRLKGSGNNKNDWKVALATLYNVLMISIQTMSPFTPFLAETFYQNLKSIIPEEEREESVHYIMLPEYNKDFVFLEVEDKVANMQRIVELGRALREQKKIELKQPVEDYLIVHLNEDYLKNVEELSSYIVEELNCKKLSTSSTVEDYIKLVAKPNLKVIGAKYKNNAKLINSKIPLISHNDLLLYLSTGTHVLDPNITLEKGEILIEKVFIGDTSQFVAINEEDLMVVMRYKLNEELENEGHCRNFASMVQKLRKSSSLEVTDKSNLISYFS